MNYKSLLYTFVELLNKQSELIPKHQLAQLDTDLINQTTPEQMAKTILGWAQSSALLSEQLKTALLSNSRANLPDDDEEDNSPGADQAGLVTNETLRRIIREAQKQ